MNDSVYHPNHYASHPSGVECIEVNENMNYNVGNAYKYIFRHGAKSKHPTEDLEKSIAYIDFELDRRMNKRSLELVTAKATKVSSYFDHNKGEALFQLWLATLDETDTESLTLARNLIAKEIDKIKSQG